MSVALHEADVGLTSGSGTSLAAVLPDNLAVGDLILMEVSQSTDAGITTPAGWTSIGAVGDGFGGNRIQVFRRIATGSDSVTVSFGGSCTATIICNRVTGFNTASPVNASGTNSATSGNGTAMTCPSVTTNVDGCLVYRAAATREVDTTLTMPGSHTDAGQTKFGTGSTDSASGVAYQSQGSAGATGTAAFVDPGGGREWVAITVAIAPAPTAAVTGTATDTIDEADIVAGGKTVILTLTNTTWVPAVGTPTYNTGTAKSTTTAPGSTGDGDLTINFPPSYTPTAGHFAIIGLYLDQGDGSTPTDWTEVTGSPFGSGTEKLLLFYKLLTGGESDPVSTISGSTANASNCANMAIYTGVGSIGAVGTASAGTGTPMTAAEVTTTQDASIVACFSGRGDNENAGSQTFGGSSTGVNERLDGGTGSGNDSQVSMADITVATSGSGSGAASSATSATDPWVSVQVELVRSTPFTDARSAIRSGLDSAQSEGTGWDARRSTIIALGDIVRTSDTVCTITLSADGGYNITAQETITATVPAAAVASAAAIVATPTFTIDTAAAGDVEVTPTTATLTLATFAPTAAAPRLVTPGTLAHALTAFAPGVHRAIVPPTAALTAATFAPTVLAPRTVTPSTLAMSLTAFAPGVFRAVVPPTASLVTAAFAPTVLAPRLVTPGSLALTATLYAPGVHRAVVPPTASLTTEAFAPTVLTPRLVVPSTASLTLTLFAPGVHRAVVPVTAELATTAFAPSVLAPRLVVPGALALSLTEFAPTVSTSGASSLLTGLVSYWPLDEASGTREDAHGSNDLTESGGTITADAGILNDAADFEADDEFHLTHADNDELSREGKSFTVTGWFKTESGMAYIIDKRGSFPNFEFAVYQHFNGSANYLGLVLFDSDGNTDTVFAEVSLSNDVWYFFAAIVDLDEEELRLSINDGTVYTAAITREISPGGAPLEVGKYTTLYHDGLIDEVGLWDRVLTDAEITALYGGGTPPEYPFGGGNVSVVPGTTALTSTLYAPTVSTPRLVTPGPASLTTTAFAPNVLTPRLVTPTTATLATTAFAPILHLVVMPGTRALTTTTFAPVASTPRLTTPGTTALSLSAFAPSIAAPRTVTPTTVNLTLTSFAPTTAAPRVVVPTTQTLTLTAFAATVTANVDIVAIPGTLTLTLATFAPVVSVTIDSLNRAAFLGLIMTRREFPGIVATRVVFNGHIATRREF